MTDHKQLFIDEVMRLARHCADSCAVEAKLETFLQERIGEPVGYAAYNADGVAETLHKKEPRWVYPNGKNSPLFNLDGEQK